MANFKQKINIIALFALALAIYNWQWAYFDMPTELIAKQGIVSFGKNIISATNINTPKIEIETVEVISTRYTSATAYSSTVDQTDSTPCITANGYDLCENNQENVIACNFLPFGTQVRIPEHYGDRIFTVQDRMNSRFSDRIDIWMRERSDAIKFGYKYLKIEIVKTSDTDSKLSSL